MTGHSAVEVDVLVVNYGTAPLVRRRVADLADDRRAVWVWDNSGELSGTELDGATVLGEGRNIFYAAASNELYRRSAAPLVLLLNPDAACSSEHLGRLVAALAEHPSSWGAAPRLVDGQGRDQRYRRRLPTLKMLLADRLPAGRLLLRRWWDQLYCQDLDPAAEGTVEQPAAACLLLRREAVGAELFDEDYPLFGNDLDLARRLAVAGSCRYVPEVVVPHIGGASFQGPGAPSRSWLRREYDLALRRYARRHVRSSWILEPLFFARLLVTRQR